MTSPHSDAAPGQDTVDAVDPVLRLSDPRELDALLRLSPDAVLVVDDTGRIRAANALAEQLWRTSATVLERHSVDDLLPVALRERHRQHRATFRAAPQRRTMGWGRQLRAVRLDGSSFPVDVNLQPIELDGRSLVIAAIRDRTREHELVALNEELAEAARSLRSFVSLAAHELRTPLTSVRGFAETLLSGRVTDPQMVAQLLTRIRDNADRQNALISSLLDLSRIEAGKFHVTVEPVEVHALVTELVAGLDDDRVGADVPETWVSADPLRLEQVLLNLVTNALRHGAPPVAITARLQEQQLTLTVRDAGRGVDPAFEATLFDAFTQAGDGQGRTTTGLGLGLYLARELQHAMGGAIGYRRDAAGGTCFDLGLTRLDGPGAAGPRDPGHPTAAPLR